MTHERNAANVPTEKIDQQTCSMPTIQILQHVHGRYSNVFIVDFENIFHAGFPRAFIAELIYSFFRNFSKNLINKDLFINTQKKSFPSPFDKIENFLKLYWSKIAT